MLQDSDDLWYKSGDLKRRFAPPLRAGGFPAGKRRSTSKIIPRGLPLLLQAQTDFERRKKKDARLKGVRCMTIHACALRNLLHRGFQVHWGVGVKRDLVQSYPKIGTGLDEGVYAGLRCLCL